MVRALAARLRRRVPRASPASQRSPRSTPNPRWSPRLAFPGRRRFSRAPLFAILALLVVGPMPALAAAPGFAPAAAGLEKAKAIPEPREQLPGESAGFRLPFAAGHEVRIEQGWNTKFSHNGKAAYAYDFGLSIGTDVLAAAAGVVAYVHDGETKCGG